MSVGTGRSLVSALVIWSRYVLLALALLFIVGAVVQVFLAGLGLFDDAARWDDHTNMGHMIGLITYILWIPAVLGRAGLRALGLVRQRAADDSLAASPQT